LLNKKLNNSLFISFYLLSLFAGSNFFTLKIGEFHLFIGRILTFILPLLLISKEKLNILKIAQYGKWLLFVITLMLGWSILSYIWAEDKKAVIVNSFYVLTGILNGFILFCFAFDSNYKFTPQFLKAWHISWLCLVIFAYLEIFFNFHIQGHFSDFLAKQVPGIPAFDSVISLFDGPNELAIYLVISIPFSTYLFYEKPVIFIAILLVTFQIIYRNDAKFCLIALLFFMISFIIVHQQRLSNFIKPIIIKNYKYALFLISFIACMLLINNLVINKSENYSIYSSFESNYISLNESNFESSKVNLKDDSLPSLTSFQIRRNLIINGINFITQHPLRGIGAGNFEYYMKHTNDVLPTKNVINSHSWLLQLMCEYGIIIGSLYWLLILLLFILNYKYLFKVSINDRQLFIAVNLLIIFVIVSNVSSSFASSPLNWTIFSLIFISLQRRENNA